MQPTDEDETARARRKSREWKARRDELAAAAREDAELARQSRANKERFRREQGDSHSRANLLVFAVVILIGVLGFQRVRLGAEAGNCLSGVQRPHEYGCAAIVLDSFWSWLLPSQTRAELRAAAALSR